MTQRFSHLRSTVARIVSPPSPCLIDAVFNGAHVDPAAKPTDHSPAVRAGAQVDRLRSSRRDLTAALNADTDVPARELAAWPPVARVEPCRGC